MTDVVEIVMLVGVLLLLVILWALVMSSPEPTVIHSHAPRALAILWHPVAPLTDWRPSAAY